MIMNLLVIAALAFLCLGPKRFVALMAKAGTLKRRFDLATGDFKQQISSELTRVVPHLAPEGADTATKADEWWSGNKSSLANLHAEYVLC